MEWITTHGDQILTIATSIVTIASVIANFTKTDVDNKVVAAISKAINWLALNFKVKPR